MITLIIFSLVLILAFMNGANDNFKGVSTLYGSKVTTYKQALTWASITTFLGSLTSLFLAQALIVRFSGKGLIDESVSTSPYFIIAVALGTIITLVLATRFGFPISTTHALLGSLIGVGLISNSSLFNLTLLSRKFIFPLLFTPILSALLASLVFGLTSFFKNFLLPSEPHCICLHSRIPFWALSPCCQNSALPHHPSIDLQIESPSQCNSISAPPLARIVLPSLIDSLHFISAGAVCFARGLNDTPKIMGLLLLSSALSIQHSIVLIAIAMVMGGIIGGRKVAETTSQRVTAMNPREGLSANLSTALLVTTASLHGLPASTTHVTIGGLIGVGSITKKMHWKPVLGILTSWILTLPCSLFFAALSFYLLQKKHL